MRLLVPLLLAGCAGKVAVTSAPAGAYVSLAGERVGVAPIDVSLPPFGPRVVRVELTGYRPLDVKVGWLPPRAIEARLVPEHGGAGTWEPKQAE